MLHAIEKSGDINWTLNFNWELFGWCLIASLLLLAVVQRKKTVPSWSPLLIAFLWLLVFAVPAIGNWIKSNF